MFSAQKQLNVTFQAATAIILTERFQEVQIPSNLDIVLLAAVCNNQNISFEVNDTRVSVCSQTFQSRFECDTPLTQSKYLYNISYTDSHYIWLNVYSSGETKGLLVRQASNDYKLQIDQKISFQQAKYSLCQTAINFTITEDKTLTSVYSVYDSDGLNISIGLTIENDDGIQLKSDQYINEFDLQAMDYKFYTKSQETEIILPWEQSFTLLTCNLVISDSLQQITSYQYNSSYSQELVTNISLPKNSQFIAAASTMFSISNFFDEIGQPCTTTETNICQLVVDANIIENTLSYQFVQSDDNQIQNLYTGIQYELTANKYQSGMELTLGSDGKYHGYFRFENQRQGLDATLSIRSSDKSTPVYVYCSNQEYFPNQDTDDVKQYNGTYNFSVELDYNMLENYPVTYIHVMSDVEQYYNIQILYQDIAQIVLQANIQQTISLEQKVETTLAFQIPDSLIIETNNGTEESFYSSVWAQVVVINQDQLPEDFILYIDNMQSIKQLQRNYTVIGKNSSLQTFMMPINLITAYNQNYEFMHIVSNYDCQIQIVVSPSYLVSDSYSLSRVPVQSQQVVYYSPLQNGINQYIEISGNDSIEVDVTICSKPVLLIGYNDDCTSTRRVSLNETSGYTLDISLVNSSQYVFYTIQGISDNTNNAIVNLSLCHINQIKQNSIFSSNLEANEYIYGQLHRNYNEDYLYIQNYQDNIKICISQQFVQEMSSQCVLNITQSGLKSLDISSFNDSPYILVHNPTTTYQQFQIYAVFTNTTEQGISDVNITSDTPFIGRYIRQNSNTPVVITVGNIGGKNGDQRNIGVYASESQIPSRTDYTYSSNTYGTNVIILNQSSQVILYSIYSSIEQQLQVVINETEYTTILEYGNSQQVSNVQQQSFIMPSSYTPSGYRVEVCKGNIEISISNETIPAFDSSQASNSTISNFKNLKGNFNISYIPSNMFATVYQIDDNSSYVLYSGFSDFRPQPTSKTIQVIESDDDGNIKLQVDKAVSQSSVSYSVYLSDINSGVNFDNACGIKLGQKVSDDFQINSNQSVVQLTLNQQLTDTHMMLNVIAHDNYLNVDNAYNSVEVYKGMPTIITTYKDNEADDLTWIIYVVLSIIILAVIIFLILFFNKRKQYTRLVETQVQQNQQNNLTAI